jgi:hypothetical protein
MGATSVEVAAGDADGIAGVEAVDVPVAVGVGDVALDGVAVVAWVGAGVVEAIAVAVDEMLGVAVAETVALVETVAVAEGEPVAVGVGVEAITSFVIVALHVTSAPPPFPESLHWSMCIGRAALVVPFTEQMKPTLVPPLPEPLHWPTVACETDVTPAVFAGVQVPGAPGPVITESTH